MSRTAAVFAFAFAASTFGLAQTPSAPTAPIPAPPLFATTKVADNIYVFRYMKTLKLPKYESWASYGADLPGNIELFCEYWGRGI